MSNVKIMRKSMQKYTAVAVALFVGLLSVPSKAASVYQVIATTTTQPAIGLERVAMLVQIGDNPINQIDVTRLHKVGNSCEKQHPVLLMASTGSGMPFYEINDSGYRNSWVGRMADDNFDIWAVDDRTSRSLPAGSCDGTLDCSIMATWDLQARVEDAEFALSLLRQHHSDEKPIIGGFVGGGIAAIAAVNANPHAYSGVLAWQGVPFTTDATIRAYDEPFCAALEGALAAGAIFDSSTEGLISLVEGAQTTPDALLPPIPGFPPGLTYLQGFTLILTAHANSPNSPTPNWINAVGDYQTATFQFSNLEKIFQTTDQLTLFQPLAMFRDIICGIARGEQTYVGNLGAFRGSAFLLGTDLAMGPLVPDTEALFTHASFVQTDLQAGLGEDDPIWMSDSDRVHLYDKKIAHWMRRTFGDK